MDVRLEAGHLCLVMLRFVLHENADEMATTFTYYLMNAIMTVQLSALFGLLHGFSCPRLSIMIEKVLFLKAIILFGKKEF